MSNFVWLVGAVDKRNETVENINLAFKTMIDLHQKNEDLCIAVDDLLEAYDANAGIGWLKPHIERLRKVVADE